MKILVVYYSMYGHVLQLARAVEQGAKAVAGVDVILRRVAEFDDVIQKTADNEYIVKVREQQADIPVCTLDDLREADGVIFGSPTRYGNMTAQMKQLIDSTATLPYGATTIAGPRGELQPTKEDLAIASALGTRVATIAKKLRG